MDRVHKRRTEYGTAGNMLSDERAEEAPLARAEPVTEQPASEANLPKVKPIDLIIYLILCLVMSFACGWAAHVLSRSFMVFLVYPLVMGIVAGVIGGLLRRFLRIRGARNLLLASLTVGFAAIATVHTLDFMRFVDTHRNDDYRYDLPDKKFEWLMKTYTGEPDRWSLLMPEPDRSRLIRMHTIIHGPGGFGEFEHMKLSAGAPLYWNGKASVTSPGGITAGFAYYVGEVALVSFLFWLCGWLCCRRKSAPLQR